MYVNANFCIEKAKRLCDFVNLQRIKQVHYGKGKGNV